MYDLTKIVILGNWNYKDKQGLQTVVMKTDGLKIDSILYLCDSNTIGGDKKTIKEEIKSELYEDQYDDSLKIKVKEVINGEHAVLTIADFIDKQWTEDTLLYFYDAGDNVFEKLEKALLDKNGKIYLNDYYDIFVDGHDIEKDIITIMKEQGLKTENMYKDSQISFAYFLSALIEKMMSK